MPKILAIDDKTDNLISLSAVLKFMIPGCEVLMATTGPEGIRKAQSDKPDTILLDIKMPDMDGYEVCRILKATPATSHIPVIMISAIRTESKDLVKGLDSGADVYLAKPIDEYVLTAQVKTALRVKAAEDSLRRQKQDLEAVVQNRTMELVQTNQQLRKEIEQHELEKEKNRKLESQLRQSQKMEAIGTLAGGIAHDFNNILFPIFGYTQMLLEDAPEQGTLRHGLTQIMAGAERARELVRQILTVSRRQEQSTRPLQPHLIIKEALNLARSSLPSTIKINQDIDPKSGMIMADPTQLHQIVMNLITNAFQAMADTGGELSIILKAVELKQSELKPVEMNPTAMIPGPYICLTVKDTGPGIEKDIQERIFDPYFTTKEKGRGTGLGLSIVNGIVQSHGGRIQVFCPPGLGTEFKIFLPAIEKKNAPPIKTQSTLERGKEKILLVDDQEMIIGVVKQMIAHLGYKVTACNSSTDALELFSANPQGFDMVMTDLTMPGMTGATMAVKMLDIREDIPIILCTGFSDSMSREKAKSLGIRELLLKPISMDLLAKTLRNVLDNPFSGR